MLAERYLRRRHAEGWEEGLEEGREEGKAEGKAEERRLWTEWNKRRLEAEAEGLTFGEPPPDENGEVDSK